jgi:hypothetical protein
MRNVKAIEKFLEEIQWLFNINNFDRRLSIMKEDEDDKCAEVTFVEDYQRIKIKIYPCFFKDNPKEQRKALLHELCHCITIPINRLTVDFMHGKAVTEETIRHEHEKATSKIENILDGLLQGRFQYARTAYNNYLPNKKKKKRKKK